MKRKEISKVWEKNDLFFLGTWGCPGSFCWSQSHQSDVFDVLIDTINNTNNNFTTSTYETLTYNDSSSLNFKSE